MTTEAKTSFGIELWLGATAGTVVKVAELLSLDPPVMSREMADSTSHDSEEGAQEFIPEGIYDPGEIKGQTHYIAGSTGDLAMIAALTSATKQAFKIVPKGAAGTFDQTGSCYVTSYGPDGMEVKGKQTSAFALKVTGTVAQAATA